MIGLTMIVKFLIRKEVLITTGVIIVLYLTYSTGWYHRGKFDQAQRVGQIETLIKKHEKERMADARQSRMYQDKMHKYQTENRKLMKSLYAARKKKVYSPDCAADADGVRALNNYINETN